MSGQKLSLWDYALQRRLIAAAHGYDYLLNSMQASYTVSEGHNLVKSEPKITDGLMAAPVDTVDWWLQKRAHSTSIKADKRQEPPHSVMGNLICKACMCNWRTLLFEYRGCNASFFFLLCFHIVKPV